MNPAFSRVRCAARGAGIATALVLCACDASIEPPRSASRPGDELVFEGTWSAAGTRKTIALGGERKGSLIDLRGSMLLAGPGRPGTGFRADVIALVDSQTGLAGRSVWTDERGDQVYGELKGEGTAARNRITGTLLGGTGRYAGVTGSYEFSWQFVLEAEDGSIQGRATGLKGRVRLAQAGTAGARP